jgi:hypothetical protein
MTRLVTLSPSVPASGAVVDEEGHGDGRRVDRLRLHRLGNFHGSQNVSATVPLERPAMATMSPAMPSSIGGALNAAEGENL